MDAGECAERVRGFTRFYTRQMGILHRKLLGSEFSVTEARILYDLGTSGSFTGAEFAADMQLDPGYVSRLLKKLGHHGLIEEADGEGDGRQRPRRLTGAGRAAFEMLDAKSHAEVNAMVADMSADDRDRLIAAMDSVETLFRDETRKPPTIVLRPHEVGDIGWVVHRHAVLYSQEYGFDATFEALVAQIAGAFLENFKHGREYCWIAEVDRRIAGSVFVVEQSPTVAKLRLLYLEPFSRGLGLGRRLVEECIRFARSAGYDTLTLWTNANLIAACRLYESLGFTLTEEEPHHSFGQDLVGQNWDLSLK